MYVCVSGGAFVSDPHIPVHGPCGKRSWAQDAGYTLTLWKVYLDGENGKGESVRTVIGAAGQPGDDDLDLRPSDAHAIGRYGRSPRIPQISGAVPPNETGVVLFYYFLQLVGRQAGQGRAELGPESPGVSDSFHFFIMVVRYVARVSRRNYPFIWI